MISALAGVLDLERFSVWGYSGGGPYAVAVAAGLPDRVVAAAIAAGMGEVGTFASAGDFAKTDRQMLALSVNHPRVARVVMGTVARLARLSPKSAIKSFEKELSETDQQVISSLGEPAEAMALYTQAF